MGLINGAGDGYGVGRRGVSRAASRGKGLRVRASHIEPELDDVAVVDDVFLAFDAEAAGFAGLGE